jgi:hypothetical protein
VQIDVWIHSLVGFDAQFDWIQFDFRDTSPQIVLPAQFTFDYSTLNQPHGFEEGRLLPAFSFGPPYLPAPLTVNGWAIARLVVSPPRIALEEKGKDVRVNQHRLH